MLETDFLNFMNIKSKNTEVAWLKKQQQTSDAATTSDNQNDSVLNIKP